MYFLHFLWDLTTCLAKVSKVFQDRMTTVGQIHTEINAAKAVLESFKTRCIFIHTYIITGNHLVLLSLNYNFILMFYSEGPKVASLADADAFQGHDLSGNLQQYHSAKTNLLNQLIRCLSDRFEDDQDILKATILADIKRWPKKLTDEPGISQGTENKSLFKKQL